MAATDQENELIREALLRVRGIIRAEPLADEDRPRILEIEAEAEAKSLMGLGKVINTGVREVLDCDWVYVAMTDMGFDWGCRPNLLMKKGEDVVGEEVTDRDTISRLANDKNVWFMHKNFVVYKDRVSFPQDVMRKICYFEIPGHSADWFAVDPAEIKCRSLTYGSPSTPCDVFLKERYFGGRDERGSGTILVGIRF
jgi:hypothetical protein